MGRHPSIATAPTSSDLTTKDMSKPRKSKRLRYVERDALALQAIEADLAGIAFCKRRSPSIGSPRPTESAAPASVGVSTERTRGSILTPPSQSTLIAGSDVDIAVVAQPIDADPTVARHVRCIDDGIASKYCPCTHQQPSDNKVHEQASQIQASRRICTQRNRRRLHRFAI